MAIQMLVPQTNVFVGSWGYHRSWLILHKTAGFHTAQEVGAYFQASAPQADGTFARTSSHYVIGLDGTIVQCVSEQDGAGANGVLEAGHDPWWDTSVNPNLVTFSIEHVDPTIDNSTDMPAAQKAASFALIRDICTRWSIPMRDADADGGITGHFSIDPISRAQCPGNYPWSELWNYLKGATHMPIPQGWHDDGTTLYPPDKAHKVVRGFRDAVMNAASWDAGNVPREDEQSVSQVELHANTGAGTRQIFRDEMLIWTAAHGVHTSAAGDEIKACYDQLAAQKVQMTAQQSQIATLQAQLKAAPVDVAAAQTALKTLSLTMLNEATTLAALATALHTTL